MTRRDGAEEAHAVERLASLPLCCQAWAAEATRQWARASGGASKTASPATAEARRRLDRALELERASRGGDR